MALLETLIVTIGSSVAKSLLGVWLKDNSVADDLSSNLVEQLKTKTNSLLAARKGAREFESIGDKVAANLEPVFRSHQFDQEHQQEIYELIASEVANAISATNISSRFLVSNNNDPTRIAKQIRNNYRTVNKQLNERELALYNRAIDMAAQHIVDISTNLPDYTRENFTEILLRLESFQSTLDRILDDLKRIYATSHASNRNAKYADFEADYRASIIRRLDTLYLFGADVNRRLKRYQLTVAYVSLHVQTEDSDERISIEEALSQSNRAVIKGDAGSGKTTLLQWIAVSSAADNFSLELDGWQQTVPFFVRLRDFHNELPSLERVVETLCPEICDVLPNGWVRDVFRSGRAILLLDGVDEVPQSKREDVYNWVNSIVDEYPEIRLVASMRPMAYDDFWVYDCGCEEHTLAPMQIPDIELFVSYWHKAVLVDQELESKEQVRVIVNRLFDKLRGNISLKQLATNPLLCAMICALHYERNMQLPSDRNALYEACCLMLLERRDTERNIQLGQRYDLTYRQKRILLDDLAYWMMKNGYSSISSVQALSRMRPRLANMIQKDDNEVTKNVLSIIVERTGVLRQPSPDEIDFLHRTFQEYMAANAAATEGDWGLLINKSADDQWHETIILAAGFANQKQADKLVSGLLQKAEEAITDSTAINLLAISCLATANEISHETRVKVDQLLQSLIPPKDMRQEKQIASAGNLAVPYLAYNDNFSEQDAVTCIRILQIIGTSEALSSMGPYCVDRRISIQSIIHKSLHYVTPQECYESGLTTYLQRSLEYYLDKNCMELEGILLHSLSSMTSHALACSSCKDVYKLRINNIWASCIAILETFPLLNSLILHGELGFGDNLNFSSALELLDLRNMGKQWPSFWLDPALRKLKTLRLMCSPDSGSGTHYNWPDFDELSRMSELTRLEVFAEYSDDLPELRDIAQVKRIQHLHIATLFGNFPDIQPLHRLKYLKVLELSMSKSSFFQGLTGFENLTNINKIVINIEQTTSEDEKIQKIQDDLQQTIKFCLPHCKIEWSAGWSRNSW